MQGCSRSLMFCCNCMPAYLLLLHRFICRKSAFFCRFTHPSLVRSPHSGCSPGTEGMKVGLGILDIWATWWRKPLILWLLVLTQYQHVTDGRTETPPIAKLHCACGLAERDKNGKSSPMIPWLESTSLRKNCVTNRRGFSDACFSTSYTGRLQMVVVLLML